MLSWILAGAAAGVAVVASAFLYRRARRAEQQSADLRQALAALRARVDALPVTGVRLAGDGRLTALDMADRIDRDDFSAIDLQALWADGGGESLLSPTPQPWPDGGIRQVHAAPDPVEEGAWLLVAADVSALSAEADGARARLADAEDELAALRTRALLLETLEAAADAPAWLRDAAGRLITVSEAYARCLDMTVDDVLAGQAELLSGPVVDAARALADAARRAAGSVTEQHHVVVAGERRSMAITEAAERDQRVQALGVATRGVARDVTAIDEAQAELTRHRAATKEMLETLQSAIVVFGPDQRLTFYNQAYATLWGLDEAWLETHPTLIDILEVLRERRRIPEYVDFRAFRDEQMAMFQSVIEPTEDLQHLPDGTTLRSVVAPHPLGGLMFVQEDVTSTLVLERNYNTLIAVQQESLDNLAEGIAVFGGDGRLRLSNPAYARMWHLDADLLAGHPHAREILDATRTLYRHDGPWPELREALVARALDRNTSRMRLTRVDGTILDYRTIPLPDGGVLNSFLDVTDSATVEQALRASNKALETADRLKSEFIANVSYQLRTPLNAILGFAEILNNQYFGDLNARQLEYAASIVDASRHLLSLINDILDIATIEAGYMELDLSRVDVALLLRGVYDLTREWAGKQQLTLHLDCPDDVGVIEADERRLKQALYNLVSNAVKFTPVGGHIRLSAQRETDTVALAVSDTGVGIAASDRERVFGRFERVQRVGRRGGVGLGLSLVKSFIELHGGHVVLESQPGHGTTVSCVLPVHPIAAVGPEAEEAHRPRPATAADGRAPDEAPPAPRRVGDAS